MTNSTVELYCLRVDLLDSEPPIWRQICLRSDASLAVLHRVLAAAMGWTGEADYMFQGQGQILQDGEDRLLSTLLIQPNDTFLYTYAPVQGWLHKVRLESIDTAEAPVPYCTAGDRQCPPEFCNGVWDYVDLLERLSDSDDPDEVDALWQRVGYDFDPEKFDLAAANRRLQAL
ncbi:MAG: plasmid pRiA4b ORF-3 family protein [Nodosilinea sp.]